MEEADELTYGIANFGLRIADLGMTRYKLGVR